MQTDSNPPMRPAINDCWNKIGVRGDASCAQLEQHTHCRNCPVFAAAAAELLNGELPADYLSEWTDHFARAKKVEQYNTESVVIFRIGAEWLALSTPVFKEVAELRRIHPLPHRRSGVVLGVVNVRGELLICVSLDQALGLQRTTEQKREKRRFVQPRLLVVSSQESRLVFPVDEVHGAHRFGLDDLTDVPATVAKTTTTYIKAILRWEEKSVGLLNGPLLFRALSRDLA